MKVYAKRKGHLATLYIDPATDRPVYVASYDDEPIGALAKTYRMEQLPFPKEQIVFLDAPAAPESVSTYAVSDEEIKKVTEGTTPQAPVPQQAPDLLLKLQNEFRALITAWKAGGDLEAKRDAEAVLTFVTALDPSLGEVLVSIAAEEPANRRRISLG